MPWSHTDDISIKCSYNVFISAESRLMPVAAVLNDWLGKVYCLIGTLAAMWDAQVKDKEWAVCSSSSRCSTQEVTSDITDTGCDVKFQQHKVYIYISILCEHDVSCGGDLLCESMVARGSGILHLGTFILQHPRSRNLSTTSYTGKNKNNHCNHTLSSFIFDNIRRCADARPVLARPYRFFFYYISDS